MIRYAYFNRRGFNLCELHNWSRRTQATIIRCVYTRTKLRVTYK